MDQIRRPRHKPMQLHCSSTKDPKTHDGEKTAFSTNVAGKTGYPYEEDLYAFHPVPKSTQNGSKTLI
jgi:hypothetical protein